MKISIEPRKGKDIGLTGQQATRIVWVLVDPSGNFIRRSPTSTPMYGTSKDRAATLIPKALRKLGAEGKESTSTTRKKTTRKKTTRKKTTRQELTVDSCRSFLESRGYEVTSEGEGYEDQLRAAGWVENPRKRTRKKQRKAADTLLRGKKGASKFHLRRELAALKRDRESLRLDYNNDLISYEDYEIMDSDLSAQMEMIERELGMYANPRKNPLAMRRLR